MNDNARREAVIDKVWDETPTLRGVTLSVPQDVAAAHERAGQYIVAHPAEGDDGEAAKPVFLAVASGPGSATLELLLGASAAEALSPVEGGTLALDAPTGKGYPIELAAGKDLLLFCVGSGASAIRSVVEHVCDNRDDFGAVTLFHGAHTEDEHAYKAHEARWKSQRIDVVRSVAKPWVQDVFRERAPDVSNAIAFVCGMKPMVAGVTEALVEAGLSADLVRQNF